SLHCNARVWLWRRKQGVFCGPRAIEVRICVDPVGQIAAIGQLLAEVSGLIAVDRAVSASADDAKEDRWIGIARTDSAGQLHVDGEAVCLADSKRVAGGSVPERARARGCAEGASHIEEMSGLDGP